MNPRRLGTSILLFAGGVGLMGLVRLYLFPHAVVSLTYGLPLLVCLWHRDRRLLWAMAAAFAGMATYKAFYFRPAQGVENLLQWSGQLLNIGITAGVIQLTLLLLDRLHARAVETSRQNEELQKQTEELQRQHEEIHQQAEEMERQAEEVQGQSEELQEVNARLEHQHRLLQILLESVRQGPGDKEVLDRICRGVLPLFPGHAAAVAVVERVGPELRLLAHAGAEEVEVRWPFETSFAAVVMEQERTAFVDDLDARPDLRGPRPASGRFRSVLASPLKIAGASMGAVKVFSNEPRSWTPEDFERIEWVAAQSSLILEARRGRDALERLVVQRTAELRAKVDELQHFSYSITHDLRAPLRAMRGFAELLNESCAGRLSEQETDFLRRITTATGRMDQLITDALNFAQVAQEDLPRSRVEPLVLLRGMLESYPAFQAPKADIRLEDGIPAVLANQAGLTQCFSNILGNAVKFTDPGSVPRIRVRGELQGGRVRIWFEDNGIGIPREMHERIFGMFQRVSKDYEGTGIGLALVRKVVERMGGAVGVESEEGKGSRFWLELEPAS